MDTESPQEKESWQSVFQPIPFPPPTTPSPQKTILHNNFSLSRHSATSDCLLTLLDSSLLLSPPSPHCQPIAHLPITFQLKFSTILQEQNNLRSNKIGIRLFFDDLRSCCFYSSCEVVQGWALCLARRINQKGFHEMFKPFKKLGKGNFASVYEVERLTDGRKFAVKAFSKQACFSAKNGKESLINELTIMRQLSQEAHPNVLQLEAVFESDNSIYVVLELLTGGQLFARIQERNGYFSPPQIRQFLFGLLNGMHHMHAARIMHRDLKPENIMLRNTHSLEPVIVDFGLATDVDLDKYLFFRCGTPGYVAPEIIELSESKHVEPQCDVFSAGVIFHVLLTRKPLFEGSRYDEVYKRNKEMNINYQDARYAGVDPQAMDMLQRMLVADPKHRITAAEAIRHSYFLEMAVQEEKVSSPCATAVSKFRVKL